MTAWPGQTDRVCDAAIGVFALWTLCAHAATFTGQSLNGLLVLFVAAAAIAAGVAWRTRRARRARREGKETELAPTTAADPSDEPGTPPIWLRGGVAAWAALCVLAVNLGAPLEAVWLTAAVLAFALSIRELRASETRSRLPEAREVGSSWIVGLALFCTVVTLVSHRPDADDGFYLNLAVSVADDPRAPMLAGDTLHRVPGVPLPLPVYRVHSLELLQGAVSRITSAPVLDVAHLWLPALAALWVPFAFARLTRRILPRAWPWATGVAVGVLLFAGTASHGWSNFGFVRLHQGKALLLSLLLPLAIAYGIDFARGGGTRRWLRLAAVQIAAVGVSASGLWLAPAVAGVGLLAGMGSLRDASSRARLARGVAASGYVLALGLALRGATAAAFESAPVPSPELDLASSRLAIQALRTVVGPGLPGAFVLFAALGAWAFAESGVARRLCAFALAATLVLWNPFTASFVAAHLTSAPTYWRVLWLLPIPTLVAVVLTAPIEGGRAPRAATAIVAVLAIVLFGASTLLTPKALAPSAANHVRLAAPGWKVPPKELAAVLAIQAASETTDRVLAPKLVAPWLPAFHGHPTPLVVRSEYLPVLHDALGPDELARRMRLLRLVSGDRRPPRALELLRAAILEDGLAIVCLAKPARRWPDVTGLLEETGFQRIHADADYEVWKRSPTL